MLHEAMVFCVKQVRSLIFPGIFFSLLIISQLIPAAWISRYDFLLLGAVLAQVLLLRFKVESFDEVKVICVFHAIGLGMELFKTHPSIGSWSYPEDCYFRISTVPLYSGFMYATVASYLCQAWRFFDVRLEHYPHYIFSIPLCAAIYLNFFTHHYLPDGRWLLKALVILLFWRTRVEFTVTDKPRRIPLLLIFVMVGGMVWVAENISTYYGAFVYPNQSKTWQLVGYGKISSWMLLVILSFIIVADLKFVKAQRDAPILVIEEERDKAPGSVVDNNETAVVDLVQKQPSVVSLRQD